MYIGLNTLQYQVPGRALGAILLSDLAQVAADRYNYSRDMEPLNIFVDECAEIANDPLIALLNKGRGAKFQIYCASQTIADFTTRLESKDKTESALGPDDGIGQLGRTPDGRRSGTRTAASSGNAAGSGVFRLFVGRKDFQGKAADPLGGKGKT